MAAQPDKNIPVKERRFRQRRQHPRATVTWPVTVIKDHVTLYGNVNNISRGGVLVFLDEKLKVGTNVRLAIEISDCHDIITARDAVVSTHIAPGVGKHGVSFSIVLKFKKLPRKT